MDRASPQDLRVANETARLFTKAYIDFVCVPVLSPEDKKSLIKDVEQRLSLAAENSEDRG